MTVLVIILAYVANVFLNRYINKIMYLKLRCNIVPLMWFMPFPVMVLVLIFAILDNLGSINCWFTGKNW